MHANFGRLADLPKADLCLKPTPIEALENLGARLGGPRLYAKRDDYTGLAFGGNKLRQLEFYIGEAQSQGADTILITGAVQSNFVRLAAASASKMGMECHIQLEERVPKTEPAYRNSGNVLLDRILGATLHSYPDGEDEAGADRRLGEIAEELRQEGRKPYIIPLAPGHKPLGALGYVLAAQEILLQAERDGLHFDEVVVASGSGATHAGLLFGFRACGSRVRVTGICVRRDAAAQFPRIRERCDEIAVLLGVEPLVQDSDIHLVGDFLAPGYGQLNEATVEAMGLAAQSEGMLLDPVYTGKVMAGFMHRAGESASERSLLFIHTGGTPSLFAYEPSLTAAFSTRVGNAA